jgi:hypothetical protein
VAGIKIPEYNLDLPGRIVYDNRGENPITK